MGDWVVMSVEGFGTAIACSRSYAMVFTVVRCILRRVPFSQAAFRVCPCVYLWPLLIGLWTVILHWRPLVSHSGFPVLTYCRQCGLGSAPGHRQDRDIAFETPGWTTYNNLLLGPNIQPCSSLVRAPHNLLLGAFS